MLFNKYFTEVKKSEKFSEKRLNLVKNLKNRVFFMFFHVFKTFF